MIFPSIMFCIETQAQKKLISYQIKMIFFPELGTLKKMNNSLIGFKRPKVNRKPKTILK